MNFDALRSLGGLSQADLEMLARVETAQAKRDLKGLEDSASKTGTKLEQDLGGSITNVEQGMTSMGASSVALGGVLAGVALVGVQAFSYAVRQAAVALFEFVTDSIALAGKFDTAWTNTLDRFNNAWGGFQKQVGDFFVLSPSLNAAIGSIADSFERWTLNLSSSSDMMLPYILLLQEMGLVLVAIGETLVDNARAAAQFWSLMPGAAGDIGADSVKALDAIKASLVGIKEALVQAGAAAAGAFLQNGGALNFAQYGPDSSLAGGGKDKPGKKPGYAGGLGPGTGMGFFGIDPVGFQTAGEAIKSSILSVSEVMAPLGTQITLMNQELKEMAENVNSNSQMFYDFVPAIEQSAISMSIGTAVTDNMIGAFEQLVMTGNFSARSFVKSVGLQVAGVLGKLAIEALTRAQMEQALAVASFAVGDYHGSALHTAASVSFLNTARAAGIGAAVAGAGALYAGLTDGGNGGGGGGGRGGGRRGSGTPTSTTTSPAAMQQSVTIYLDGQGFIQDPMAFAATLQDSLDKVNKRRGRG